jgi:phage terminase large subunit GpA-like protein
MTTFRAVCRRASRSLIPPPRLKLSEWMEKTVVLPEGDNAQPGRLKLLSYQREIADCISDPTIERVTLLKAARIGFSLLAASAIAYFVANDPAAILVLLPTEADARDTMVSQIEPLFQASPSLRNLLAYETHDRNTILSKRFPGGSLKLAAAKSPRNLRRHTVRVLFGDEIDAMDTSGPEGNPLMLAENRTITFSNRLIVMGSTPLEEDTSHIIRTYNQSDSRVFEVPCPACGAFTEILWRHIEWESDKPETAAFRCPHCEELIDHKHKNKMVNAGVWRARKPEVVGHAGFRLNALVSPLPNVSWGKLAAVFVDAKDDPGRRQVFVNTCLAEGWKTPSVIQVSDLQGRAENFDLNNIPPEVLSITIGADVQDDRIEVSICGWTRTGECLVLAHDVIWGSFTDADPWDELAELLRGAWRHPHGGLLRVDAGVIDAGDGDHFSQVMNFCLPRLSRRIFPGKGLYGARPAFAMSKGKKVGNKLALIGVDTLKSTIFDKLQHGRGIRFSNTLEEVYFEQLASERRVVRYARGMPQRRFERIGRVRAEGLDCMVYAHAARQSFKITFDHREAELRLDPLPKKSLASKIAGYERKD